MKFEQIEQVIIIIGRLQMNSFECKIYPLSPQLHYWQLPDGCAGATGKLDDKRITSIQNMVTKYYLKQ